jgi:hypothetical protein
METKGILENLIRTLPPGRARRRYERMLAGEAMKPPGGVLCNPRPALAECGEDDEPAEAGIHQQPYIDGSGNLVIPTLGPEKYHWWKGGQRVLETLNELGANHEILTKYSDTATNQMGKKAKEDEDGRATN